MNKTRRNIVILLIVIALGAVGFLAYRFTLLSIHAKSYRALRDRVMIGTTAEPGEPDERPADSGKSPAETEENAVSAPAEAAESAQTAEPAPEAEENRTETDSAPTSKAAESVQPTVKDPAGAEAKPEQVQEAPQPQETVQTQQTDWNWQSQSQETQEESWKKPFGSPVDFDWLQSVNPDVYAWIEIPGTEISFPVLQDDDDIDYYLRRFYDGSYSIAGSIFSAPGSAKDFSDFNTVLYGHNFGNSYMFGDLKEYRDEDYLKEHRTITVYTPNATLTYQVFGAVVYDNVLLSSKYRFDTEVGRMKFLQSLSDVRDWNSHVMDDMTVSKNDRILVLSTCTDDGEQRFLVTAVLVNRDE